ERSEGEQEKVRSGLVLCYGRVAEAAPPELLRSRLENHILQQLLRHGHTKVLGIKVETKDPALKLSLARSVSMISRALARGNSGNSTGIGAGNSGNSTGIGAGNSGNSTGNGAGNSGNSTGNGAGNSGNSTGNGAGNSGNSTGNGPGGSGSIARKAELVALMVEFLKAEPPDSLRSRLRQRALSTCSHLLALEPPLTDPERSELLDTALGSVLALPPTESGKNREEPPAQDLFRATLGSLTDLLRGILRRRLSPHGLQELFAHLGPWIKSPRVEERERAVGISHALLEFFLGNLHVSSVTPFYNLSSLLALLAPRCSDGIPKIRRNSVDCVQSLLRIQLRYEGFSRSHRDELVEGLESLKEGLENPDFFRPLPHLQQDGSGDWEANSPEQLLSLLLALLDSWEDPDGNCSRCRLRHLQLPASGNGEGSCRKRSRSCWR
ncbi:maestro heat-like repeat-containing protein family member 1, partial [Chamaea fasciata]|uniref:maestro heat-like repeat-containing protein family member 1 n=1 Tax=Chamaea fasciata TaxID=190680 RepID=UPI00336A0D57